MTSPTQITVSQLSRLIGLPNSPIIIDTSSDEDFALDPRLIPSAFRYPFSEIATLAPELKGKNVILVCQKGLKISQGAAAILKINGIQTESLEGGNWAWRDAGLPLVPLNKIPLHGTQKNTLWVTKLRPKIDRIACPWLIRRFIDRNAQFLFVEASQVENVAEKFNATPFDVEDTFWGHRGEKCTFDTMVEEFELNSEPLARLATIVRAADTNRHDLAPQAAGLMAASLGLSRMYRDDNQQLEAGLMLYDAFYRWSRNAADETHSCPTNQKPKK